MPDFPNPLASAPPVSDKRGTTLKVQEPAPTHVGRNIVTLDRKSKQLLSITSGDIVEIEGTKKTAAIVWPARTEDEGKDIIRMDNLIRNNAGVNLGEKVIVRPAQFKEAQKVVLAPTQDVHIIASGYERILKKTFIGRPLVRGDNVWITVFGSGFIYRVVETAPRGIVKITDFTQFVLKDEPIKGELEGLPKKSYDDVGGLRTQVEKVRELVELPMRHPELFRKLGIDPPKGVLMHGPPGTGKTLLAKAVANETQAHFISINAPQIMSKFVGEAEERVRQLFKEAEENAPSIIFIDEIDAIAPKREEVMGEVERRVVAQLLALMDGMESRGNTIVIAATNRVNSLDEALRRPGRFDREIEIGVPDKDGRLEIMQIHTRGMPLSKDVDLDYFAGITYGFVGADLTALVKESAMKALRRYLPEINLQEETIPEEVLEKMEVTRQDFDDALKEIQPSALREIMVEIPNVKWEDIGSLEDVKAELKQAVEWPLKNPKAFTEMGIRPPRGVLLYGPPGTGKTLLAKAIATESQANFISIKGPELISKWVGESLPYDEELLVFNGKNIFRREIGKIVENKEKVKVVTFDQSGKVLFSDIVDFIKHPLRGKMMRITTSTGRNLRVTDKHSLFTFGENGIEETTPGNLKAGVSVIASPSRIPNINTGSAELNLIHYFKENDGVMIANVQGDLQAAKKKVGHSRVAEILGLNPKYLHDVIRKNLPVRLPSFLQLIAESAISLDYSAKFVGVRGARSYIPVLLPITDELCRLMGVWVAEGDYNVGMVRIHNENEEIRQDISKIVQTMGLGHSLVEGAVVINSGIFKKVFEDVFSLKTGSRNKRAPIHLLSLDSSKVQNFLRGYFSGDGCISKSERCFVIEASTVSKQLANDLLYLFLKLGIVARYREKKEWNGSMSHCVSVQGVEHFRKFSNIGFIDRNRNDKLFENIANRKWERSNVIPVTENVRNILDLAFHSYPSVNYVGTKKLKEALLMIDAQRSLYTKLWELVESDIYWDKVEKIEEIEYTGDVFDVSVEPCQNFVGGFGGIFAHNSEKGIRQVFKKARQVAPVIVFFDEIDAIASIRGGMDGGSGVGERVVNQLLTELDGAESLKDVVFVAATNRPDLIDPGLMRPGRIDKVIEVKVPDERGREAILKVHTRGVPLAKGISLADLASRTPGYSGADLANLIREAALMALQESDMKPTPITKKHFDAVLAKTTTSVPVEATEAYAEYRKSRTPEGFKPNYIR